MRSQISQALEAGLVEDGGGGGLVAAEMNAVRISVIIGMIANEGASEMDDGGRTYATRDSAAGFGTMAVMDSTVWKWRGSE